MSPGGLCLYPLPPSTPNSSSTPPAPPKFIIPYHYYICIYTNMYVCVCVNAICWVYLVFLMLYFRGDCLRFGDTSGDVPGGDWLSLSPQPGFTRISSPRSTPALWEFSHPRWHVPGIAIVQVLFRQPYFWDYMGTATFHYVCKKNSFLVFSTIKEMRNPKKKKLNLKQCVRVCRAELTAVMVAQDCDPSY